MSFRTLLHAVAALTAASFAALPARAQQYTRQTIDFSSYRSAVTVEPGYQATFGAPLQANGYSFYDVFTQSSATPASPGPTGFSASQMSTWGTASTDLGSTNLPTNLGPTAAALWGLGTTDRLEMYSTGNGVDPQRFRLYSMDMSSLFAASSITPALRGPASLDIYFQYYKSLDSYLTGVPDGDLYAHVEVAPTVNNDVNNDIVPLLRTVDFSGQNNSDLSYVTFLSGNVGDLTDATGIYGIQWFQGSLTSYSGIDDWTLAQRSGLAHQFTNVVVQDVATVPEPTTFALAGVGLLTVVGVAVRRRQTVA